MNELAVFFSGVFLCNSIPHLAAGLQGNAFPTPFARPRGVGYSSALINVVWGLFNVLMGMLLTSWWPLDGHFISQLLVALAGALAIGSWLAVHFARVKAGKGLK